MQNIGRTVVGLWFLLISCTQARKIGGQEIDKFQSFKTILVIGGDYLYEDGNSTELLEIPIGSDFSYLEQGEETVATQLSDFPVTVAGAVGAGFEFTPQYQFIIICGGEQNGIISADCWIKKEDEEEYWRKGPSMPEPRKNAGFFIDQLDKKLIVMGGQTTGGKALSSTIIFWAGNETWTEDPKLALPSPDHGLSLTWDYINFQKTGGFNAGNGTITFKPSAPQDDRFENLLGMNEPRNGHASFVGRAEGIVDLSLIVAGGKSTFTPIRSSEVYDKVNKKWIRGPDLPRDFAYGCVIGSKSERGAIYLIGGHKTDGRVIIFKDKKFHLTNIRLKTPRENCVCAIVPEDMQRGIVGTSSSESMNKGSLFVPLLLLLVLMQ